MSLEWQAKSKKEQFPLPSEEIMHKTELLLPVPVTNLPPEIYESGILLLRLPLLLSFCVLHAYQ
jgi:hypothetical protein